MTEPDDGDEPFRFPDNCQLCGAPMTDPGPDRAYVLGGIISVPNDTGGTSMVCVCDPCFRKHRTDHENGLIGGNRH